MKDGGQYFDFKNNKEDQHFRDLDQYYGGALNYHLTYQNAVYSPTEKYSDEDFRDTMEGMEEPQQMAAVEDKINGPQMDPKRYQAYLADVKKRAQKEDYMKGRLFGKFK